MNSMRAPTNIGYFVSAISLLLYLSEQCCARGQGTKMTLKPPDEVPINHVELLESAENKKTSTIVAASQEASHKPAELQGSSLSQFSFNAHFDMTMESNDHCQKARRCTLKNDHRPERCSCHSHCQLFGDCCEDAVASNKSKFTGVLPRTSYSCYLCNSPIAKAVNIITSCPDRYDDEAVVKACNRSKHFQAHDANIDSMRTPVTDVSTGLTYGNMHCAICWEANLETSEPWHWNFYCSNDTISKENNHVTTDSILSSGNFSTIEKYSSLKINYLRTTCRSSYVPPRRFPANFTECDPTEISTCPSSFEPEHELVTLCHGSPSRRVYYNQVAYKNVYCLACNNAKDQNMAWSCLAPQDSTTNWRRNFDLVVSPSRASCDGSEEFSESAMKMDDLCRRWNYCMARARQLTTCFGVGLSTIDSEDLICRVLNVTSLCSFDEESDNTSIACSYWSLVLNNMLTVDLNATVTMCYSGAIESFDNYTFVKGSLAVSVNGTSWFYKSSLTYVKEGLLGAFITVPPISTINPIEHDGSGCQAVHWGIPMTTLLCSQCCSVAYFALYIASERLRSFLGEIVLNQALAFFLGFTVFIFRWFTDYTLSVCRPMVILIHFLYTAAFMWTSLFAIEVARSLSTIMSVAPLNRAKCRRVAYYMVGWCLPLSLVLLAITADELGLEIAVGHGKWECWFGGRYGSNLIAIAPMGICQTIDVVVYVYMIVRLALMERQTRMVRERWREKLLLSIKLFLACGLLWSFCLAAVLTGIDWLNCAFKIVTSLQGTFILLVFGIKRDVLASLKCCQPRFENPVNGRSTTNISVLSSLGPRA